MSLVIGPFGYHVWCLWSGWVLLRPQTNLSHVRSRSICCEQFDAMANRPRPRRPSKTFQVSVSSEGGSKPSTQERPQRPQYCHRSGCDVTESAARYVQQVGKGWILSGSLEAKLVVGLFQRRLETWNSGGCLADALGRVALYILQEEAAKVQSARIDSCLLTTPLLITPHDANVILGFRFSELMQLKTCDSGAKGT
jgi:hypothetical protein